MQFNFNPKVWGAPFWYVLHLITFAYPDEPSYIEQRGYHDFFVNLQHVIPCWQCKQNYTKHLQEIPIGPYLSSKTNLINWLTKIHNKVNSELGKPPYTVQDVIEKYSHPPIKTIVTNYCPKSKSNINWFRAIMLMLILLLIIYYYKFRKNTLD
jgi:hypothetical protein